jgi:hypothetical protein
MEDLTIIEIAVGVAVGIMLLPIAIVVFYAAAWALGYILAFVLLVLISPFFALFLFIDLVVRYVRRACGGEGEWSLDVWAMRRLGAHDYGRKHDENFRPLPDIYDKQPRRIK